MYRSRSCDSRLEKIISIITFFGVASLPLELLTLHLTCALADGLHPTMTRRVSRSFTVINTNKQTIMWSPGVTFASQCSALLSCSCSSCCVSRKGAIGSELALRNGAACAAHICAKCFLIINNFFILFCLVMFVAIVTRSAVIVSGRGDVGGVSLRCDDISIETCLRIPRITTAGSYNRFNRVTGCGSSNGRHFWWCYTLNEVSM